MNEVDNKIKYILSKNIIPTLSYALITNKTEIKYFNTDENKLFDMASLTKVIVTTPLIAILKEQNKIKNEDLVIEFLPDFKYKEMTIYHLLTHTSGFKKMVEFSINESKEEYIKKLYDLELTYKIGECSYYCDLNYILLGLIIESIYKEPLDKIAKELIFDKLDMKDTTFNPIKECEPTENTNDRGLIKGVVHDNKAFVFNGVAGHAGLFSNVKDISNFIKMILNNGIYNNNLFLRKESIDEWFKPLYRDFNRNYNISYSWVIGKGYFVDEVSENTISHGSFTGGIIVIDRENKKGLVILANSIYPSRDKRNRYKIYRKIIGNDLMKESS